MFKAVNPKVDIQKVERDVLDFWRANRIFERSMEERKGSPVWVTYEGPPTVNGNPGVHHVLARAFKDIFPRYKTMRGHYVLRKGGWDTHGLPVEIAIEKELGFTHKRQIEEYGIAAFNEKCRQSVLRNIGAWERFTERMAYWTSLDDAYVTFTNDYVESIWWVLKQMWDKNLLYKGFKVVPYCSRCGTALSSHEVALGYKDVKDPSVFVRFPLRDKPGVYFLVWTTTPWTLPANVALAVGEDIDYVQVEGAIGDGDEKEQLILAAALVEKALIHAENYTVVKRMKGKDLLNMSYSPLYTFLPVEEKYAYVVGGNFVSTVDGTGIVHIAPAFGVDDMEVARKNKLPILQTVASDGTFIDAVTEFRGKWVKDADPEITRDLKKRGLMYKSGQHEHTYPFCWRCGTALLYYARDNWFIRSTDYRDKMMALNQTINWVPEHVREGRFGNWLTELKDWALSRERYWGTTLPIWVDEQTGESMCIGSVAELSQLVGRDLTGLDLHRPYVDDITFPNPNRKGGIMRRVPEVIDVWFDSGAMPVAQWGYPHQHQAEFAEQFPADYICEAVDQTRGWFYTLHAIGSMVFENVAFKNVICLGLILDEKGQKMSKSKGNVVDPWEILNSHGSDAFRWYLYTASPPGEPRRFSKDLVGEIVSKFWLTLWNTYKFFIEYANIDSWTPSMIAPLVSERDPLDRYILAELHQLTKDVTIAFEEYDVPGATRPVQSFVEMLSNWYLRLSRRRFWKGEMDADKQSAYATLYECLVTLSKLIAPTAPFIADALYRNLVVSLDETTTPSVHLTDWATYDDSLIDDKRIAEMRLVQRVVSLGRAARESVKIGVRQPLSKMLVATRHTSENATITALASLIESELNIKVCEVMTSTGDIVQYKLNPLPQVLGKKLGKEFPRVQKALREGAAADVSVWAEALLEGHAITVDVDGQTYTVTSDECQVVRMAAEGYAVADDNGYLVAIDTTLTEDLINEGLAREVVRRVQSMRADADFNITDTIVIKYDASEKLARAIQQFGGYISEQTLATSIEAGEADNVYFKATFAADVEGDPKKDTSINGETLTLGVKRSG